VEQGLVGRKSAVIAVESHLEDMDQRIDNPFADLIFTKAR